MNDVPKILKIRVLKEDFVNTSYMSNTDCPIARAIARDLWLDPTARLFSVGGFTVPFLDGIVYEIQNEGRSIVYKAFNQGEQPNKIEIILTLIEP